MKTYTDLENESAAVFGVPLDEAIRSGITSKEVWKELDYAWSWFEQSGCEASRGRLMEAIEDAEGELKG